MPDANGQYQLQDYIAELKAMGFDQLGDAYLTAYVNRGYFHVARKNRWVWEETTGTFTVTPGSYGPQIWPIAGGSLPNFRSLDKLYITTTNYRAKLRPMNEDQFFERWLPLDLTATQNQGIPDSYYLWGGRLYILSPPNVSLDFIAHYHRRVSALVASVDVPITPIHLDEAILIAAKIRCHKRANEVSLAATERADLEEFFDDMRDDEEELMDEELDRVVPDRSWL